MPTEAIDVAPRKTGWPRYAEGLGTRAERRAMPRFGPAMGGAAAAVAFLGVLILSFDTSTPGAGEDDGNHVAAAMLCAAAVVAGYVVVGALRTGAAATAGSAIAVGTLPFVFVFLTLDLDEGPPFSVDITLLVSTVLWAAAYSFGPSRGRPAFGAAALIGLWLFVVEQVESIFTAPFQALGTAVPDVGGLASVADEPDPTMIGVLSLAFGVLYLAAGFLLDRRALEGLATPFLLVGVLALAVGYASLADDLEVLGTGILIAASGAVIAYLGGAAERRGTTWVGATGVALGLLLVVGDIFEDSDSATVPSIVLVLVGATLAALAEVWGRMTHEPPEVLDPAGEPEPDATPPGDAPWTPPPPTPPVIEAEPADPPPPPPPPTWSPPPE